MANGVYNHGEPPFLNDRLKNYQREYFLKSATIVSYSTRKYAGETFQFTLELFQENFRNHFLKNDQYDLLISLFSVQKY